jgi:hypothetical protein
MIPRSTMEKDLRSQEKALTEEINALGKKVTFSMLLRNLLNRTVHFRSNTLRNSLTTRSHSSATSYVYMLSFWVYLIRKFSSSTVRQSNRPTPHPSGYGP